MGLLHKMITRAYQISNKLHKIKEKAYLQQKFKTTSVRQLSLVRQLKEQETKLKEENSATDNKFEEDSTKRIILLSYIQKMNYNLRVQSQLESLTYRLFST